MSFSTLVDLLPNKPKGVSDNSMRSTEFRLAMMKKAILAGFWVLSLTYTYVSFGQTCTVTGTSPLDWANPGPGCTEGGNAGSKTVLIIPAGFTLNFDSNDDTWTGTRIEVYGTLNVSANPTINGSIFVKNGGRVNITGKLSLGSSAGCGYIFSIQNGGVVDVGGTGSDRLTICGVDIMKGNGACNSCGGTNSAQCTYNGNPYCEPTGGFIGPLGYSQGGYDSTLPVTLLYFHAAEEGELVNIKWATTYEKDFLKFVVQRSQNGIDFQDIGEVAGAGRDIDNTETKYSFEDKIPLLGMNYYRLKGIDLDDSFEFFDVQAAKFSGSKHMTVHPNPSSGETIYIETNFSPSEHDRIHVSNAMGIDILSLAASDFNGQLTFENKLLPGVYFVTYISQNFKEVSRLIVKN
jgi:hypothetical protein